MSKSKNPESKSAEADKTFCLTLSVERDRPEADLAAPALKSSLEAVLGDIAVTFVSGFKSGSSDVAFANIKSRDRAYAALSAAASNIFPGTTVKVIYKKPDKNNFHWLKFKSDSRIKNPDAMKGPAIRAAVNAILIQNGVSEDGDEKDLVFYASDFEAKYGLSNLAFISDDACSHAYSILEKNRSKIIPDMEFFCAYKRPEVNTLDTNIRSDLRCRFYENEFPVLGETVMVKVIKIDEIGAYVNLLEYNDIQGLIQISDLSKRRFKSINSLIQEDTFDIAQVTRVDSEKGFIDLSKRSVEPLDKTICETRYHKSSAVHLILRFTASANNCSLQYLYENIAWPLYRRCSEGIAGYSHPYDAFKIIAFSAKAKTNAIANSAAEGTEVVDQYGLSEVESKIFSFLFESNKDPAFHTIVRSLIALIKSKLAPEAIKIRADIELTCCAYEGVEAIKRALLAGEARRTAEIEVSAKIVSSPNYILTAMTLDKDTGIKVLEDALNAIEASIRESRGTCNLKMPPTAMSDQAEHELLKMLKNLKDGGEEEEENEEEGGEWNDDDVDDE